MVRLFLLSLIFGTLPCSADDIEELLSLVGIEEMIEKSYDECLKSTKLLISDDLHIQSVSNQMGIDTKSKHWKELEEIYNEFYSVSCKFTSAEDAKKIWRKTYRENLSKEEIEKLIKFYSQPLGKKIVKLDLKSNNILQEEISKRYSTQATKAQLTYEKRINELYDKINQ